MTAAPPGAWGRGTARGTRDGGRWGGVRDSRGMAGRNFLGAFGREDGRDVKDTPLELYVRHVEYMVERMGIDHVGIGSDLGVPSYLPDCLQDATAMPALFDALAARGFDDTALRKIANENWLRVLGETWK